MADANLTCARLREMLHYDPATGSFVRLLTFSNNCKLGVCKVDVDRGYSKIHVAGRRYYAHRLAWFYVHGEWPAADIDHIDGNRANNAIANLRSVSRMVNLQNLRVARRDSKTGLLGVSWSPQYSKYVAQIGAEKQHYVLGRFDSPEEAHQAYLHAKRRLHEGCTI